MISDPIVGHPAVLFDADHMPIFVGYDGNGYKFLGLNDQSIEEQLYLFTRPLIGVLQLDPGSPTKE